MKPILCPCCNRKFAKQETLLRHLNTAHRSKPGVNPTVIGELNQTFTITTNTPQQQQQNEDENTIVVVTDATTSPTLIESNIKTELDSNNVVVVLREDASLQGSNRNTNTNDIDNNQINSQPLNPSGTCSLTTLIKNNDSNSEPTIITTLKAASPSIKS